MSNRASHEPWSIATAFEGVKRIFPEMPDDVNERITARIALLDLVGALTELRSWEMMIRGQHVNRYFELQDQLDAALEEIRLLRIHIEENGTIHE